MKSLAFPERNVHLFPTIGETELTAVLLVSWGCRWPVEESMVVGLDSRQPIMLMSCVLSLTTVFQLKSLLPFRFPRRSIRHPATFLILAFKGREVHDGTAFLSCFSWEQ